MPAPISDSPVVFHEIPAEKLNMALGLLRRAYKGDVDRSARWLVAMIQAGSIASGPSVQQEIMGCISQSGWHASATRAMAALIVSEFRPRPVVCDPQGRPIGQTPIHNNWREAVVEAMAGDIRQRCAEYGYSIKYPVTDQRFTALPGAAERQRAMEVPFPFRARRGDGDYPPYPADPFRSPRRSSPPPTPPPGSSQWQQAQDLSGGIQAIDYAQAAQARAAQTAQALRSVYTRQGYATGATGSISSTSYIPWPSGLGF